MPSTTPHRSPDPPEEPPDFDIDAPALPDDGVVPPRIDEDPEQERVQEPES